MANPAEALEMSDEEFLKQGVDSFKSNPSTDTQTTTTTDTTTDTSTDDSSADDQSDDDSGSDAGDDEHATDEGPVADDTTTTSDKTVVDDTTKTADTTSDKTDDKVKESDTEPDYAAIGKQLLAEFKANGTTMKIKSVDDAIQLMQMGANYHKKMAGLKPSLKTLKLLENHGLLDEAKLNYLIDLSQKKPEAITQLLKDSGVDPMTIDLQGAESYTPSTRTINDTELLLDEVLESISSSPVYNKTLTVLGEEWDSMSRTSIAKNPEAIRAINMHMESGIYDQVVEAVAYERSLGKLSGVSDFDAYQRVGTYMHENSMFKTANVNQTNGNHNQTKQTTQTSTNSDTSEQDRLNRKQAASPSRQQKTVVKDTNNYNPLEMSDEDFVKLNKLRI
jgi:hypothetical protein